MRYEVGKYTYGGTCVRAITNDGEPYATCSVNLVDYGLVPKDDMIIVPTYQFTEEVNDKIISDLADEVIESFTFGPYNCAATLIRLKSEYAERVK